MASDRAGTFYYTTTALGLGIVGVLVARSTNGGKSWSTPTPIVDTSQFRFYLADKEAITAGRDPLVAGRDNLYVAWNDVFVDSNGADFTGLPVARSSDGGRTWQVTYADKFREFVGCSFQQYLGAQPFVDPRNGTLNVAAERLAADDPDCRSVGAPPVVRSQVIFKSTDGGRTFGPRMTIATRIWWCGPSPAWPRPDRPPGGLQHTPVGDRAAAAGSRRHAVGAKNLSCGVDPATSR